MRLKKNTVDMESGKMTGSQGERIAEGRSQFETEAQKKRRLMQQYLKNTDRVLRPKKA